MEFRFDDLSAFSDEHAQRMKDGVTEELEARGVSPKNAYCYRSANVYGFVKGNTVAINPTDFNEMEAMNSSYLFYFVPLADYNAMMGTNETLEGDQALLYSYRTDFNSEQISFQGGKSFQIKKKIDSFTGSGDTAMDMLSSLMLVVPDLETALQQIDSVANYNGDKLIQMKWICNLDTGMEPEEQIALYQDLTDTFTDSSVTSSQEFERDDFYGLFGSLFYLGMILSLVFLLAAVLIIYYKQISEGYEDQARFAIMQKVGMTKREIRKSINSQLLTVFFFPLVLAAIHMCFAFPIVRRLLLMFNLSNVVLFATTTGISLLVFAVFYTIVYRLTSNAYYKIVSDAREEK